MEWGLLPCMEEWEANCKGALVGVLFKGPFGVQVGSLREGESPHLLLDLGDQK